MGIVERYGLGALFLLCSLIVLVGIFGEDETRAGTRTPAVSGNGNPPPVLTQDRIVLDDTEEPDFDPGRSDEGTGTATGVLPPPVFAGGSSLPKDGGGLLPGNRGRGKTETDRGTGKEPKPRKPIRFHTIRKGDTLARIAKLVYGRGGSTVLEAIRSANPGLNDRKLIPGHRIRMPELPGTETGRRPEAEKESPRIYVVRKGDSLSRIVRRFYKGSSWSSRRIQRFVAERNGLSSPDRLTVGMKLRLPPLPGRN